MIRELCPLSCYAEVTEILFDAEVLMSHVRFLVVAVPSQSLVVHLPIAERLHHLMTKPDCCLFCCVVASSSSELYLKTDDACSSGSPIC